ncbi:MAG: N-acetyltransferase [Saprospiraceae bacterium]|jgi:RimJ/RimL family protein N-acetyltransferase
MQFSPITHTLKNGKTVHIREARVSDAAAIIELVHTYIADSDYIPQTQGEFQPSLAQETEWIQSFQTKDNSLLLVAECDGKLIGNIDLTGHTRIMMQHTAVIGMGMLLKWRNCGLGTALMQAAIEWARQQPVLEVLWLQVYAENELGISLYRKMGFAEHGIIPNYFKREGKYFGNLTMSLSVIE